MSDIEKIVSNFISLALDVESENFTDGRLQRWNNMLKELEALIQEQVRQARIDEIERIIRIAAVDDRNVDIRLKELKK